MEINTTHCNYGSLFSLLMAVLLRLSTKKLLGEGEHDGSLPANRVDEIHATNVLETIGYT